ncbi:MAG: hypothetical protein ACK5XN_10265, partial [Bacteroidota bacterium]
MTAGAGALGVGGYFGLRDQKPRPYVVRRSHPLRKYTKEEFNNLTFSFHSLKDTINFFPPVMNALFDAMKERGLNVVWRPFNGPDPRSDIAVVAGWGPQRVIAHCQQNRKNILVVEQGFIQTRNQWPSFAWNGLANYGIFPEAPDDGGASFHEHFGHLLKPWKEKNKGYALLLGQVPTDFSLYGLDYNRWTQVITDQLNLLGYKVCFRPHPWELESWRRKGRHLFIPHGALQTPGTLEETLDSALIS